MSRKIALPLLVAAALVSIILASRTPQLIIEELPPEEADAPTALLTQTEEVGDQTVTLRVYEPDEAGYARYALFGADGDLSRTGQYRYADALHGKRHEGNDAAAYHRYSRRVVCRGLTGMI